MEAIFQSLKELILIIFLNGVVVNIVSGFCALCMLVGFVVIVLTVWDVAKNGLKYIKEAMRKWN